MSFLHIKLLSISIFTACTLTFLSLTSIAYAVNTPQVVHYKEVFNVYKSASCGCCNDWIAHMNHNGLSTKAHNIENLSEFKVNQSIPRVVQSCHTAVSAEGYVFEGHVPAKSVKAFLLSPPIGAKGLAVAGMPLGSPGMEYQGRFQPYKVLLMMNDGSVRIFNEIESLEESIH